MRTMLTTTLACLACLSTMPAVASDLTAEPRLGWTLSFGGAGALGAPALQLALDAPQLRLADSRVTLAQVDLAGATAALRLAGLPLWQRDYRLAQNDAGAPAPAEAASSPWYAHQWVYWTAAGLAVTTALASSASGGDNTVCSGICGEGGGGDTSSTSGGGTGTSVNGVGPDGIGCVNDTCAVPCTAPNKPIGCVGYTSSFSSLGEALDVDRARWLDAGTGQMGDLLATQGE